MRVSVCILVYTSQCMCFWMCVSVQGGSGTSMIWYTCGGLMTTSGVSPHCLPVEAESHVCCSWAGLAGLWASTDSPFSASGLTLGVLWSQVQAIVSGFMEVPGIQTQVLMVCVVHALPTKPSFSPASEQRNAPKFYARFLYLSSQSKERPSPAATHSLPPIHLMLEIFLWFQSFSTMLVFEQSVLSSSETLLEDMFLNEVRLELINACPLLSLAECLWGFIIEH